MRHSTLCRQCVYKPRSQGLSFFREALGTRCVGKQEILSHERQTFLEMSVCHSNNGSSRRCEAKFTRLLSHLVGTSPRLFLNLSSLRSLSSPQFSQAGLVSTGDVAHNVNQSHSLSSLKFQPLPRPIQMTFQTNSLLRKTNTLNVSCSSTSHKRTPSGIGMGAG